MPECGVWSVKCISVNTYMSMRSLLMPEPCQCFRSASIPEYRSAYSEDLHRFPLTVAAAAAAVAAAASGCWAAASGRAARPARAAGLDVAMSMSMSMQQQQQHGRLLEAAQKGMAGVPPCQQLAGSG